jgi:hypothetical protein
MGCNGWTGHIWNGTRSKSRPKPRVRHRGLVIHVLLFKSHNKHQRAFSLCLESKQYEPSYVKFLYTSAQLTHKRGCLLFPVMPKP